MDHQVSQSSVNLLKTHEDDFLSSVKQSIANWRTKNSPGRLRSATKPSPQHKSQPAQNYKHEQFKKEQEQGAFEPTNEEITNLDWEFAFQPEEKIPMTQTIKTPDEKRNEIFAQYTNKATIKRLNQTAEEIATEKYRQEMEKVCSGMIKNQEKSEQIKKKLKKNSQEHTPTKTPRKEDRFNKSTRKIHNKAIPRNEVIDSIVEIYNDLKAIRADNLRLAQNIEILEKAKMTLLLNESGAKATLSIINSEISEDFSKA